MAPEVLESDGYSKEADVYSFGILMHEVYTGKEPYSELGFKKPWRTTYSFIHFFIFLHIFCSFFFFSTSTEISEHVISGGVKSHFLHDNNNNNKSSHVFISFQRNAAHEHS